MVATDDDLRKFSEKGMRISGEACIFDRGGLVEVVITRAERERTHYRKVRPWSRTKTGQMGGEDGKQGKRISQPFRLP